MPDLEQNQLLVLPTLGLRIRTGLTRLVVKTKRLLHESMRPLPVVVGLLRDLTRSRDQLIAENALLRQQLIVASRKVKRPVFKPHERGLMVLLSRIVRGWRDAVLLVKPETTVALRRVGAPKGPAHRTVLVLFTYGSSGRRVANPVAGRFTTSPIPVPN